MDSQERRRAEGLLVGDGVASRLMDSLTGGVVLAGLGLHLGASNFVLGMLAAIPFVAQAAVLPAIGLMARLRDRRRTVVVAAFAARLMLLSVAVLLLLGLLDPLLLAVILAVHAGFVVVATTAWNWWMRDLLDPSRLGRFFARRLRITTLVVAVASLGAGAILDEGTARGRPEWAFAVLLALGVAAGFVGIAFLLRTPHEAARATARPPRVRQVLRDPGARRMLWALGAAASAASFALPFAAVYLLRGAGYSFLAVTTLAIVSSMAYVLGLRGWGYQADRQGNRPLLQVALGILVLDLVGWSLTGFLGPRLLAAALVLLHILGGLAMGGLELASHNLLLRTAPEHDGPAHLATVAAGKAFIAGLVTLVAGGIWQAMGSGALATVRLPWVVAEVHAFHILCAIAGIMALAAIPIVARSPEPTAASAPEFARGMRREIHQMSSVAGIRAFLHAVSYIVLLVAGTGDERKGAASRGSPPSTTRGNAAAPAAAQASLARGARRKARRA